MMLSELPWCSYIHLFNHASSFNCFLYDYSIMLTHFLQYCYSRPSSLLSTHSNTVADYIHASHVSILHVPPDSPTPSFWYCLILFLSCYLVIKSTLPSPTHTTIIPMFPGSKLGLTLPQPFHYFHVSSDSTIAEPPHPFNMAIHSMLPCSPLWLALFHASEYSLPRPSMWLLHMAIAPMFLGIPLLLPLPKPSICLFFPCFRVFSPQPFHMAIVHMLLHSFKFLF